MPSDTQAMYDGAMTDEVKEKADRIKHYLMNAGNYICTNCGGEMVGSTGCKSCPKCGSKDCGNE